MNGARALQAQHVELEQSRRDNIAEL